MRFTLRQIMLLPLVLLLTTYVVCHLAFPPLLTLPWQRESNSVSHAQNLVEDSVTFCHNANISVSDETINLWLQNRLPPSDRTARFLLGPPRRDAWGKPYRIQTRKTSGEAVRVYSTGEDGVSRTDGNDPDDIRSWEEQRGRWYSRRQFIRGGSFYMIMSALLSGIGIYLFARKAK